jgi:MFS family permease
MNKIIKILILNDFFFWTGLGFVGPILAIYINDDISGGTLGLTGLAMALYWILKSLVSILTSRYTDKEPGNKRELKTLVLGGIIVFLIPFGYLLAQNIIHIIIVQALFGIGAGLAYPGWMTIFTRFLSTGKEGFIWSMEGASINIGNGLAVAASGFIAQVFGFTTLFILVIIFNFLSLNMLMLLLRNRDEILSNHNPLRLLLRKYF